LTSKIFTKFEWGHPRRGLQMQVGYVKIGDFRQITAYNSKTAQDWRIVSIERIIGNRMPSIEWLLQTQTVLRVKYVAKSRVKLQ